MGSMKQSEIDFINRVEVLDREKLKTEQERLSARMTYVCAEQKRLKLEEAELRWQLSIVSNRTNPSPRWPNYFKSPIPTE
jgi:hypothetical protein